MAFVPVVLGAAELKVDHATIAGPDLKQMEARLAAVGIKAVYGGAHTNHATEMALVSFSDGSYLELMGIQERADAESLNRQPWAQELKENAGPCAWACATADIAAETARLKQAGVAVTQPERSGRERPDGVKLEWETANVGGGVRGAFFPFLIQDFTPRERRAFPKGKPVTRDFEGIRYVVIAVRNLEDAVKRYRQAYGLPEPLKEVDAVFGAQVASFGTEPVILAQPLVTPSWISARIEQFGEGPCAIVLGGARRAHFAAAAKSHWMGTEIAWFDPGKLGWHLGFTER